MRTEPLRDRVFMDRTNRQIRWMRILLWTALVWFAWAALSSLHADEPAVSATKAVEPASEDGFWYQLLTSLFNSRKLLNVLKRPEFIVPAFIAVNLIVFVETGLLIGFCLPGDSLLVTVGLVASPELGNWNLPLLLLTLCISAIVGDSVGYSIGWKTGPRIFNRENSLFFHKDHLLKAQAFYEKHGGKTIIMARFVPIVRTFAPVVAGVGRMEYRRFLMFNIIGGIGWVVSLTVFGYYLPSVIQPLLRPIFGQDFEVQDHVEKVILIVVFVSILPIIIGAIRHKRAAPASPLGGEGLTPLPPSPHAGEGLAPFPPSPPWGEGLGVRGESGAVAPSLDSDKSHGVSTGHTPHPQPLSPKGSGEPDAP